MTESEAKTEVPSLVWAVTTRRGAGSWALGRVEDIFLTDIFSELRLEDCLLGLSCLKLRIGRHIYCCGGSDDEFVMMFSV
jgi:hypothetical protein